MTVRKYATSGMTSNGTDQPWPASDGTRYLYYWDWETSRLYRWDVQTLTGSISNAVRYQSLALTCSTNKRTEAVFRNDGDGDSHFLHYNHDAAKIVLTTFRTEFICDYWLLDPSAFPSIGVTYLGSLDPKNRRVYTNRPTNVPRVASIPQRLLTTGGISLDALRSPQPEYLHTMVFDGSGDQ
jgi:hypothetical protein